MTNEHLRTSRGKNDECYTLEPKKTDVDGFDRFIKQYKRGLSIEKAIFI